MTEPVFRSEDLKSFGIWGTFREYHDIKDVDGSRTVGLHLHLHSCGWLRALEALSFAAEGALVLQRRQSSDCLDNSISMARKTRDK